MSRVLVIGATGTVGREVKRELAACGVDVVAGARRPGAGGVALDLADPRSIREAARDCDAAFLNVPLGPDETALGLAALDALAAAGVGKVVHLAVMQPHAMAVIPHVAAKLPIRAAVLAMGGVAIEACFFFQNDLFVRQAIEGAGVYPMPLGHAGVSAVDAADIGAAAARALTRPDWDGEGVPVCGPEALVADDFARNWADALGRRVYYAGDDVEPFVAAVGRVYPGYSDWVADDFRVMMRHTQARGCRADAAEQAASRAIIGREPRRHRDWVLDQVSQREDAI